MQNHYLYHGEHEEVFMFSVQAEKNFFVTFRVFRG